MYVIKSKSCHLEKWHMSKGSGSCFCCFSCSSPSGNFTALEAVLKLDKWEILLVRPLPSQLPKKGNIICCNHSLLLSSGFKFPRHLDLPQEIRFRRLTSSIDIDHSQKGCCRINGNLLIYENAIGLKMAV